MGELGEAADDDAGAVKDERTLSLDDAASQSFDVLSVLPDVTSERPASTTPSTMGDCPMLPRVDPATLPSCCMTGNARCVPASFVPTSLQRLFGPCMAAGAAGACVPDAIIRGGTSYRPRVCMSIGGAEGRCMSVCIPEVARNAALLPQADCAMDEKCTPCVNPLTGMSTGACDPVEVCQSRDGGATGDGGATSDGSAASDSAAMGDASCAHTGPPIINPASFPACCAGAHCVPSGLVPASFRSQLAACAGGSCTPDAFIASGGRFVPTSCRAFDVVEGRCLSTCLPAVISQLGRLAQGTCTSLERCVPCYDPFTGVATGACSQSCDTGPREPARTFPRCCSSRGQCVPPAGVPEAQRRSLARRDCPRDLVCAPSESLDPTWRPQTCGAVLRFLGRAYAGVCISDCADFGFIGALTLDQGNCPSRYTCAPCVNPLTGRPSGAPGC